jgi:hypothetical protein
MIKVVELRPLVDVMFSVYSGNNRPTDLGLILIHVARGECVHRL